MIRARSSPPASTNTMQADHEAPARTASPISVQCACLTKNPQSTDGSREYTWCVGRTPITAAQTMNPAADDRVEQRLHHERRRERRVARPLDPVPDQVELDDIARAGRRDRVDPDPGQIGAEDAPVPDLAPGIGGPQDRLPGVRRSAEPHEVDPERDRQELPAHGGELLAEHAHRMEELTHSDYRYERVRSPGDGRGTLGRRVPRDDLLPRLPDRRVPPADSASDALDPRRGDARRLARVGRRDAEAARGRGARRARPRKEAILTETGRERAERTVRKHRIIERLLTDFMGYTAAEAHVHADELGDTFSDDMVERIRERLGNPERCPHGWPIDTDARAGGEPRARAALGSRARPAGDDRAARRARRRPPALVLRRGARPGHDARARSGRAGGRPAPGPR